MKKETATRITVMILGLFIMSLGIAFSTKAGLGTTPISCVPYVLSQGFPLSFGTFTFFMNSLFVVFQYFLLKDRFEPYQWLQIPLIFVFSVFTNLSMLLVDDLIITGYVFQTWIFCLVSCILVAFGIALLLKANLLMMAGDAHQKRTLDTIRFYCIIDAGTSKIQFPAIQSGNLTAHGADCRSFRRIPSPHFKKRSNVQRQSRSFMMTICTGHQGSIQSFPTVHTKCFRNTGYFTRRRLISGKRNRSSHH